MKKRLVIWCVSCAVVSLLFFRELLVKIPQWLSTEGLQRFGVFHWGVLGLCVLWLWLKRADILPHMKSYKVSPLFIIAGLFLLVLSVLLPKSDSFFIPEMLLGWLGIFIVVFARAALIPVVLLAVYAFSIAFPLLMNGQAGELSVKLVTDTMVFITRILGLPVSSQGSVLHFIDTTGNAITTAIVPGCAGYATIGVFISLFVLMMLDIRLPLKKAWYVFLIGLTGTWLQNVIRILLSIDAGYFWGRGALYAMHYNAAYVIFPLWYTLFAWIYLKQAGWRRLPAGEKTDGREVSEDRPQHMDERIEV